MYIEVKIFLAIIIILAASFFICEVLEPFLFRKIEKILKKKENEKK